MNSWQRGCGEGHLAPCGMRETKQKEVEGDLVIGIWVIGNLLYELGVLLIGSQIGLGRPQIPCRRVNILFLQPWW